MKTLINIKADRDVKEAAVRVAEAMGVPLSTIVNAFLKQFIAEQRVTFVAPLVPSRLLKGILRRAEGDIKKGKNLSPLFTSAGKMDKYLADL